MYPFLSVSFPILREFLNVYFLNFNFKFSFFVLRINGGTIPLKPEILFFPIIVFEFRSGRRSLGINSYGK